jgi:formate--tetrahydrofolate ligase
MIMALEHISKVAKKVGISEEYLEYYGNLKAKIDLSLYDKVKNNPDGKLVLVTAITPTKAGEGKTTTSIALLDGLYKINQKALLCLREPSLGPVFGLKGGATGGGKVTIEPSEDINLHFTGDMHALTSSINLISAVLDNHIYFGNELNIDPESITWKRALDMNDRELRTIEIGFGEKNGIRRTDHFQITVASELMAILCLASDPEDFKERVANIIVGYTYDKKPVYVRDLQIVNAVYKLMKNALKPNIVQTQENNPCFVHGGPFANIAHGCSSIIATKLALKLSPIVITEAGFASDLGAEKFFDIKSRVANLKPDCAVLVATIRALKLHGGEAFENLENENIEALKIGFENLEQHYFNLKKFGVPVVVAINHFKSDTEKEIKTLTELCKKDLFDVCFLDGFLNGGAGSTELAHKVCEVLDTKKSNYKPLYDVNLSIKEKIEIISKEIYRADGVVYEDLALKQIEELTKNGKGNLPVCMAKTPQSFSDDPKLLNCPKNFKITVREVNLSNGAGFVVVLCGNILTMPGLPRVPQAVKM